jgi:DDB1- and CUL4-associated factor 13
MVPYSDRFFSVGDDKIVKCWSVDQPEARNTYIHTHAFTGIDHHRATPQFATSSNRIDIWSHERSEPTLSMSWGAETITTVKFNQTETNILASCGSDRTVCLYDLRTSKPLSKVILAMRSNAICWNPMEAFNFTVANEDHNCYTFDMRKLNLAKNVSKGHVSAVMDIDYSPTGQEFVTGGYDRTLRIFPTQAGKSRDIYHTKRMQRVFCARFTMDAKFIVSGSDDGNVRLWKANASEHIGTLSNRERDARMYNNALKERYKNMPEVRRIDTARRVPSAVRTATHVKHVMTESVKRKEDNLRKHSREGAVPYKAERKKNIIAVEK